MILYRFCFINRLGASSLELTIAKLFSNEIQAPLTSLLSPKSLPMSNENLGPTGFLVYEFSIKLIITTLSLKLNYAPLSTSYTFVFIFGV